MASNFESSIQKGSDLFFDFPCFMCKENDSYTEADFYCTQCSKFYCGKCVENHNQFFKKHSTLGKEKISSWPHDFEEQCQEHKGEKLTAFCEDHDQLLCHVCHIYTHKNCSNVVLITDKVKALQEKGEFKQLSAILDTLHGQFIQKEHDFEESIQSLEKSFKQMREEINHSHKKTTDHLDHLKAETIKELDTLQATLKLSIQMDIKHCNESVQTMKGVKEDWQKINGKNEIFQFITYTKCLDHIDKADSILQETAAEKDITFTFQQDSTIDQTLSTMSGLGKILRDVKQPTPKSITTDENTTQAEPKAPKLSSISSKDPDKVNQTIAENDSDQVLLTESSSSKQSDKTNPTSNENNLDQMLLTESCSSKQSDKASQSAGNDSDQMFPSLSSSSKKSDAGNQSSNVKQSGPVSSASSLPDHRKKERAVNKPKVVSDPNKVMRTISHTSHTEYSVKELDYGEKETCCISGICETDAGELVIIDCNNRNVKLLNKTYKVVDHCDLPDRPWSICSIDSNRVAVTLGNGQVHLFKVTKVLFILPIRKLVHDRTLQLEHECRGIAYHQDNLYITSDTALFRYTMDGTQMMKMYEHISNGWSASVGSCAVSPDGDRIYVTNMEENQLVTFSRDGKVIFKFSDRAMDWRDPTVLPGLNVTDSGQVLVCGIHSCQILQLDRDGSYRLNMTPCRGFPISVYYSNNTRAVILGRIRENNILVIMTV